MADKRFWLDMDHRATLARNDKLMVGNIDNQAANYIDVSELLAPLTADDLAAGTTNRYYPDTDRTKVASLPADVLGKAQADGLYYPLSDNPAGYLTASSTLNSANLSGIIATALIPNLSASKITSGTFNIARIPGLDASKTTSGVFDVARIPDLPTSKIIGLSGELANYIPVSEKGAAGGVVPLDATQLIESGYIPGLDADKIVTGVFHEDRIPEVFLKRTEIGEPLGPAGLDENGKIFLNNIPDTVLGQVKYVTTWDASTNTPELPPADSIWGSGKYAGLSVMGSFFIVSVAGTYESVQYAVGDWILSDGTVWQKVENSDAVTTVFGRVGNILAVAGDYNSFYVRHDTAAQGLTSQQQANARTNIAAVPTSRTISSGAGLTGGGNLTANRTIALSAATQASLGLADTSLQPGGNVSELVNDAGYELQSNKALDFTTLNNTLYPTTQAVADYVASVAPGTPNLQQVTGVGSTTTLDVTVGNVLTATGPNPRLRLLESDAGAGDWNMLVDSGHFFIRENNVTDTRFRVYQGGMVSANRGLFIGSNPLPTGVSTGGDMTFSPGSTPDGAASMISARTTLGRFSGFSYESYQAVASGQSVGTPGTFKQWGNLDTSGHRAGLFGFAGNGGRFQFFTASAQHGSTPDVDLTMVERLGVNSDGAYVTGELQVNGTPVLTAETDPVFSASPAAGITGTDITNWNTAFGWGNHASVGYALNADVLHKTGTETKSGRLTVLSNTLQPFFVATVEAGGPQIGFTNASQTNYLGKTNSNQLTWGTSTNPGNNALIELQSNKALDFTTLNNTLYPTTQAVADYVASVAPGTPNLQQVTGVGSTTTLDVTVGNVLTATGPNPRLRLLESDAGAGDWTVLSDSGHLFIRENNVTDTRFRIYSGGMVSANRGFFVGSNPLPAGVSTGGDMTFSPGSTPDGAASMVSARTTFGRFTGFSYECYQAVASGQSVGTPGTFKQWGNLDTSGHRAGLFGFAGNGGRFQFFTASAQHGSTPDVDLTMVERLGVNSDGAYVTGELQVNGTPVLTAETDPVFSASPAAGITGTDITNWNTAFGWGNHASAGYELQSNKATTFATINNTKYPTTQAVRDAAVTNIADTYTSSEKIMSVITLSQSEYDAIGTKNANTLYVIV